MLRKTSHIILSALLLFSTVGLTISKHYCGGKHVSTSIYSEAEACCDSDDCCKNETEVLQLDEDFSVSAVLGLPESIQIDLLVFSLTLLKPNFEEYSANDEIVFADSLPPPKTQTFLAKRQIYLL